MPRPIVTVFGSSDPAPGEAAYGEALAVGRRLAELGFDIANGGYGGTMEASARGAREGGAAAYGVTCSRWKSSANAWITNVVATGALNERLDKLVELGSAGFVALPGATGTLLELALVWELVAKKFIPPRPIVCWGEFWMPVIGAMTQARAGCEAFVTLARDLRELTAAFGRRRQE